MQNNGKKFAPSVLLENLVATIKGHKLITNHLQCKQIWPNITLCLIII